MYFPLYFGVLIIDLFFNSSCIIAQSPTSSIKFYSLNILPSFLVRLLLSLIYRPFPEDKKVTKCECRTSLKIVGQEEIFVDWVCFGSGCQSKWKIIYPTTGCMSFVTSGHWRTSRGGALFRETKSVIHSSDETSSCSSRLIWSKAYSLYSGLICSLVFLCCFSSSQTH